MSAEGGDDGARTLCALAGRRTTAGRLLDDITLELGETYEVSVKFMSKDLALAEIEPGTAIVLWVGKDIAAGRVLRLGR